MANYTKDTKVYTKAQIIHRLSRRVRVRRSLVEKIYNGLEEEIRSLLASADRDSDVSLRLFEGITVDSHYLEPKGKLNNLTGERITTLEKIKAKAKITRYYCEKLLGFDDSE